MTIFFLLVTLNYWHFLHNNIIIISLRCQVKVFLKKSPFSRLRNNGVTWAVEQVSGSLGGARRCNCNAAWKMTSRISDVCRRWNRARAQPYRWQLIYAELHRVYWPWLTYSVSQRLSRLRCISLAWCTNEITRVTSFTESILSMCSAIGHARFREHECAISFTENVFGNVNYFRAICLPGSVSSWGQNFRCGHSMGWLLQDFILTMSSGRG